MPEEINDFSNDHLQSSKLEIHAGEARAKLFNPQEAAQIRQAIQNAQQTQPLIGSEQLKMPNANSLQIKESKTISQIDKDRLNQPATRVISPEIHAEEARAKIYTTEQLATVRKAIAREQANQMQKRS